ncbi:hypothetical protein MKW92_053728 [Papaver armeniacum]|nr:hypothetical protein MKW92_053728 [Papaver armeniacum]
MMSSSLLGKRRLPAIGREDLTTIVLCVSFCLVLLIHQITLSSLTKKSPSSSSSSTNSTATQELLEIFSSYPIINLDNETSTHCFPSATVGLISHGFMTIDPTLLPNSETLRDFRALLESAYAKTGLQTNPTISASTPTPRPRLLVVSRIGENVGRVMSNQAEVVLLAKDIGFDVTVFEPTKFTSVTETTAAMTNLLFLRPGSVFMQVVPIGTDWAAEICYGKPAKENKYGKDSMVVKDPKSVSKKDWSIIKKIYLTEQNVRVNLVRFEKHLRKAYKKVKKFMDKVG